MMDPEFAEEFTSTTESANEAIALVLVLNIIIKLILRQSLKSMWNVVNLLQLIVYFHFINVRLAAHAEFFFT